MIYLDNAATSWPKPDSVYDATWKFMKESCANPGRSSHEMARASASCVLKARELAAKLFNIDNPLDIGFTSNATHALNIAIQGVLKKGDHVVTTAMEHNSVLRPLYHLNQTRGITYTVVQPRDKIGTINAADVAKSIRSNTRLIICTSSSNVTGTLLPYNEIGQLAYKKGIYFLLDASQGAGELNIDVKENGIALLAFPGHKGLMGPQGTGGLYVGSDVRIKPVLFGGTGSRSFETIHPSFMPDMVEAGTVNTPGLAGLGAGLEWIFNTGMDKIREKRESLVRQLYELLKPYPEIELYSRGDDGSNCGALAFQIEGMDSSDIANQLDAKYKIAVRPGFHCAPLAHKALGTEKTGLVRVSPGYYNTPREIEAAAKAILEIASQKGTDAE